MSYTAKDIRNVCLLGHGSDGKTTLAESMLYTTKGTDRFGKISEGNTVSDYDAEEIKRQISISASCIPIEYNGSKINLLDNPGYFDFAGEVRQSLRVVDSGIIVCAAKSGIGVGTEKSWKFLTSQKMPRLFYVSKLDEENSDFYKTFDALREKFGLSVAPMNLPIIENEKVIGIIDIVRKQAYRSGQGKAEAIDIPDGMKDDVESYFEKLCESVAETSEEYMEKYFSGEPFTVDEINEGIRVGVKDLSIAPVFCGCAMTGMGSEALIKGIIDYTPSPLDGTAYEAVDAKGETVEVKVDPNGPTILFVYKTVSDQYGKFSYFKVVSGKLTADAVLLNPRTGETEKLGHIFLAKGKKTTEVKELSCGDIGAVSKLALTKTGDTLCEQGKSVTLAGIEYPEPSYSMAIAPKIKGQEDKIAAGLTRLGEEDYSFNIFNNPETHQLVLSGIGDIHLDVLCSKLKNKFNVDVELFPPKVAYREKIRKKVQVRGRHKKQSGGHGQFGDVVIDFEPGDQEDLVFEEKVFGGSVPKNFFPAVEKGLRDSIHKGVLAGYPVVNLKATLVDGSYHPVDSSEMAFKTAAQLAYKEGLPQANPVLLEPIGSLKVTIPDNYMGEIIGDLNKRRGRVLGMNPTSEGDQVVEAEVPMAEMSSYAIDLRSMTQGRGSFKLTFERYEEAPMNIQEKVVADAKTADD